MKKIYYIENTRMPTEKAHGIQIMKMCEAFAQNGMEVELLVPQRRTQISANPFEYYGVKENFNITRIWCLDTVSLGRFGFWVESATFSLFASLYLLFKSGLFYTRDELPALCLKILGKKVVWESHMGQKNIIVRTLLALHTPVVVITHGLKEFYKRMDVDESNIFVSPDAFDPSQFTVGEVRQAAREGLGFVGEEKVVMYIGLFDEWKGYLIALEASKAIKEIGATLVMIGGSDKQNDELRGRHPEVRFMGYRPYSELPVNQKAADVLLIPNSGKTDISRFYTSPLKLFAHMASGVPVVASDLPSIKEIIDESMAYFFTPDDPEKMVFAIKKIFSEYPVAVGKAQNAKEKVKEFSWNNRAKNILEYIHV